MFCLITPCTAASNLFSRMSSGAVAFSRIRALTRSNPNSRASRSNTSANPSVRIAKRSPGVSDPRGRERAVGEHRERDVWRRHVIECGCCRPVMENRQVAGDGEQQLRSAVELQAGAASNPRTQSVATIDWRPPSESHAPDEAQCVRQSTGDWWRGESTSRFHSRLSRSGGERWS